MKKSLLVAAMGVLLAMALPCMAFAAYSPSSDYKACSATGSHSTAAATYAAGTQDCYLVVEPYASTPTQTAALVTSKETVIETYQAYMSCGNDGDFTGSATITFNVGASNASKTAHVYCVHGRDASAASEQIYTGTVDSNGNVSVTISSLSYYTVTVENGTAGAITDGSATSPSTGASPLTVVLATGAAIVVAGAAAGFARRKLSE